MKVKKILILGGTGMLGHVLFTQLSCHQDLDVYASARTASNLERWFSPELIPKIRTEVDANEFDTIAGAIASIRPDTVINCIGLIKQSPSAKDPFSAIAVNALLPHRISLACKTAGARLIHISTDCVFDGMKGNYREDDPSDAKDLYGKSKFLGETASPHCVTLRTSVIGHALNHQLGLMDWLLAQEGKIRGYTRAIFSGLPTVEVARIIGDHVLPRAELSGVYHVSSEAISKYDLLRSVAERYDKGIEIEPFDGVVVDRSLDSSLFQKATGYRSPPWPDLVDRMHRHYVEFGYDRKSLTHR
ncbi:MAG: SDR family oxidoreductase [Deltaproteobacteria bacterium]|nr:SDR family oxidoreductase [Deltaproteobacteria bacterium]